MPTPLTPLIGRPDFDCPDLPYHHTAALQGINIMIQTMDFRNAAPRGSRRAPLEAETAADSAPPPQADLTLLAQFASELAGPINAMHSIVLEFSRNHHITHAEMLTLVESVEGARRITRQSQQIARLAEGKLRQSHERIQLDDLLQRTLKERAAGLQARGVELVRNIKPVEIIIDPGLLFSLVETAMDWASSNAKVIIVSLAIKNWPEHGLLTIKASGLSAEGQQAMRADSLTWQLLTHTASAMGVTPEREITLNGEVVVRLEFARTVKQFQGLTAMEIDSSGDSSFHNGTKPLAGLRVLLVSADSFVRGEVESAGRRLSLQVDSVQSVEKAKAYVKLAMPHLLVIDERLSDDDFEVLQSELRQVEPNLGFIEIADQSNTFEVSSWMSDSMTRISRESLRAQLPSVLTLELARNL